MAKNTGRANAFRTFGKMSHNWGEGMNINLVKAAALLSGTVLSKTTAIPPTANENDTYIDPATRNIYYWVDAHHDGEAVVPAQWWIIQPTLGLQMLVADEQKIYWFNQDNQWQFAFDLNATHRAVQRAHNFYNPYRIRPSSVLFHYCAGTEFVIPAGAPGSGATLDIPAAGDMTFQIQHNNSVVGSIFFEAGETQGSVNVPNEVVVHPAIQESAFVRTHTLLVRSPANTYAAEGLAVSIMGKIRAID